ncbi:MAG: OFA family MFS transporter [Spirochaetes bacterium]|nr:OFA family MFS transporter [Spirochaetota bacterium]
MSNSTSRKAWLVLWAAIGINFLSGILYIWSIIGKALMSQLNWTSFQASLPYTVFSISFAASMALAGPIQDKKGPRFVALIGSFLVGSGLVLTGLFLDPVIMVITFGIFTGFGIGTLYAATVPPALKWFPPEKKGMINGIVVAMVALSSLMYSPVTNGLVNSAGIGSAFWLIGIVLLFLMTGMSLILRNPGKDEKPAGNIKKFAVDNDIEPSKMLKTASFYKMWLMFALSAASGLMVIAHAATIAKVQAGWGGGFILVIVISVFNGIGRSFGGTLSDKIGRPNLMRLTFVLLAVNMFMFSLYTNYLLLMMGVAFAGMCYGACMVVFSASTSDLFGMKNFGANYGLVFTAWGIGGILGPIPSAIIYDATKSFNTAYLVAGCMAIAALVISLTFNMPEDDSESDRDIDYDRAEPAYARN